MKRYFILFAFVMPWLLGGCSSYTPLTYEETRQLELNDMRKLCYTCFGPHSSLCEENFLETLTRGDMEVMCFGGPEN